MSVSVWATSMYYITTALIMGSCTTNLIYIMPSVPGDYHFNFGVAKFFSACLPLPFNKLVRNEWNIKRNRDWLCGGCQMNRTHSILNAMLPIFWVENEAEWFIIEKPIRFQFGMELKKRGFAKNRNAGWKLLISI